MRTLKIVNSKPQPVKLDQQFALRIYGVTVLRVVTNSLTYPYDELLRAIAQRRCEMGPNHWNAETLSLAQRWIKAGLLHKTIRKGLLHLIGENAFWSEVAPDEWEAYDLLDPSAFVHDFSSLVRIADLSAIFVPEELRTSLSDLEYRLDEDFEVNQVELKSTARQVRLWALNNLGSVADFYVDDFANRALHNRQLCQEISLWCVASLGLLFDSDQAATTYKYSPNKGRQLFERERWPSWVRKLLNARERGLCASCAVAFQELTISSHIDHILPLAAGGSNDISNLQLLCSKCNIAKKASHQTVNPSFQNYIQVGEKIVPCTFVSLAPDYGGWYHPENIPPLTTREES
jgi:HNH endonuclease